MITFEQAVNDPQYRAIPSYILTSLYDYVEHHSAPGHFLTAILSNDLFAAFGRADRDAQNAIGLLITFIHNNVRTDCYGSPEKVSAWLNKK
jgi:hypothetical protein